MKIYGPINLQQVSISINILQLSMINNGVKMFYNLWVTNGP